MAEVDPKPDLCKICLAVVVWEDVQPSAAPRVTLAPAHAGHLPEPHWHDLQTGMCENGHPAEREIFSLHED
jgi:hypothetical protein